MIEINRDPTPRQLRQFGLIWLVFFGAAGAVSLLKIGNPIVAAAVWSAAVVVPVVGWLAPPFMRVVFVGMSLVAWPIGFAVSHLVLALVYYLVVTPVGVLLRVFRYDPMQRRFDPGAPTYWVRRERQAGDSGRYLRQF